MDINIKTLPGYHVAYLRHIGSYMAGGIPATWAKLNQWCQEQGFGNPRRNMIGISWSDPKTTPPEDCCYDACVEIERDYPVPAPLAVQAIPGGTYVVARYQGTPEQIGPVWHQLFTEWLPQSAYQFDPRPCFELYPSDINCMPEPGVFICDICIPVRPKQQ
ncbi:AraC family transcriptional regulator [Uliginosibacterium gangwonense]|uniref:AraC family transcriptional regulator n=1 Tax=Uliginosibacterium gangwonense TaxID=392736 RepID=UPI00035D7690|nr:GyrI-like domain-containing protein [Uliginosibacterium gangwonense]